VRGCNLGNRSGREFLLQRPALNPMVETKAKRSYIAWRKFPVGGSGIPRIKVEVEGKNWTGSVDFGRYCWEDTFPGNLRTNHRVSGGDKTRDYLSPDSAIRIDKCRGKVACQPRIERHQSDPGQTSPMMTASFGFKIGTPSRDSLRIGGSRSVRGRGLKKKVFWGGEGGKRWEN